MFTNKLDVSSPVFVPHYQYKKLIEYLDMFLHHDPYMWEDFEPDSGLDKEEFENLISSFKSLSKLHQYKGKSWNTYPLIIDDYNSFRDFLKSEIKRIAIFHNAVNFVDENIFLYYVDQINGGEF